MDSEADAAGVGEVAVVFQQGEFDWPDDWTPPWFSTLAVPEQIRRLDARDEPALDHFGHLSLTGAVRCGCGRIFRPAPTVGPAPCPSCGTVRLEVVAVL